VSPSVALIAGIAVVCGLASERRPVRPRQLGDAAAGGGAPAGSSGPQGRAGGAGHHALGALVAELGLPLDPAATAATVRWATVAISALAFAAAGPLGGVAALAAVSLSPRLARPVLARRRADRRDAQLPELLERLASSIRAGSTPAAAFVATAQTAPDPLARDLARVATEVDHGAALAAALARWGARAASPQVSLTANALGLAAECGGEVARSVDRVAATLRERRERRGEVRALATQARASAAVLAMLPLGFTALVASIDPAVLTVLVASPLGLLCLTVGLLLEALGAVWMSRIVRSAL